MDYRKQPLMASKDARSVKIKLTLVEMEPYFIPRKP
jgi:hypothetical protein